MRIVKIIIPILLLCFGVTTLAQTEGASLDERGYGLYIPTSYDEAGTEELPLVIALHGFGDTWENFYPATGLINRAEQGNFIVAFPQGYLRQWNDGSIGDHEEDEIQLFRDLIARVQRDYRVDEDRIYLVGFSNGGSMVFKAACEAPDLFAGIASIAGTMRSAQSENCEDASLPVLIIHGTGDEVVPWEGSVYRYSVTSGVTFWAMQNSCDLEAVPPFNEELFRNGFSTYFFEDCEDGNFVMLHAIENGGHTIPGSGFYIRDLVPQPQQGDTARLIWSFFELTYQAQQSADENPEITPEATETSDE